MKLKNTTTTVLVLTCLLGLIRAGAEAAAPPSPPEARPLEPQNPKETAAKKSPITTETEAKYHALVASLPPDQQEWEKTLQQCLGSFYLPLHMRDRVNGKHTAWDFVRDDPKLPRVLLIGDSVSRGYTLAARKDLAEKANVHRAPENCGSTANGLKKLDIWLGSGKWDVIHFNFGIHDKAVPVPVYEQRLEEIVTRLEKTGATLVWASTTPIPSDAAKGDHSESIVERNNAAARIMQRHHIAIDDLYGFILPQIAQTQNPNDVHFNAHGYDVLGQKVGDSITAALKARTTVASVPPVK